MTFLAPRTGHISRYSCPFDLVPSRINSCKCPLQNRGFRVSVHFFFFTKKTEMACFWPKRAQNRPKCSETHQNGPIMMPKQPQTDAKTAPKRPQSDAGTMPNWSQSDTKMTPKCIKNGSKSPQHDSILVPFWSQNGPKIAPDRVKNGSKPVEKVKSNKKNVQKSSRPS